MGETVIRAEKVSKRYRLGEFSTGTLGEDLNRWWANVRGKEDPHGTIGHAKERPRKSSRELMWALHDISFDVKKGEVLGIIGRNGAGKSTLLKILSKVTSASEGSIKVKGRIASLLEVGTGFHPELTGRENTYLNGAILGMRNSEIKRKFDEIVDFSGVERYIDTPVKRYSSGMYVRLAFAVAAHLESEILIMDEVLAVGDAEFQKKCLGKMGEVSRDEGRTVLFVSHNMGSINSLCSKAIVLKSGGIAFNGDTEEGIYHYLDSLNTKGSHAGVAISDETLVNFISLIVTTDLEGSPKSEYGTNQDIYLQITADISINHAALELGLALMDRRNNRVFTIHEPIVRNRASMSNERHITVQIPKSFLAPGRYSWIATIHIPHQQQFHLLENVCEFQIVDVGTQFSNFDGHDLGVVMPNYKLTFR